MASAGDNRLAAARLMTVAAASRLSPATEGSQNSYTTSRDTTRPGPGLLAHVLVAKYCDHLPLYRQSRIFARDGVELDRSTLAGWVGKATALLEPLAEAIGRHMLAGQALFADDTPVKLLAPGTGKTATGRVWTYVRDRARQRRRPGTGSRPTARPNIRRRIWRASAAGCTATAMPGSARSAAPARSAKSPVWRMCGASSSMSMPPRPRRSPPRRWNGLRRSTPSRRKPADSRPGAASQSAGPGPRRASTIWSAGCKRSCRRSPPRPRWRRQSGMR